MTPRQRARARKHVRTARTRQGTPRPLPAHRTYTPELIAHVQHRYEQTPEPVIHMAADLGIHPSSVHRLAKSRGWVRRNLLPARDMSPALRLLVQAQALEAAVCGAAIASDGQGEAVPRVSLPPRSGGEGRPPQAVGVGGFYGGSQAPPTPDPSPPFAARMGGGEQGGASGEAEAAAAGGPPSSHLPTLDRLERAVLAELATVEAMRAALGKVPQKSRDAERTVRNLGLFTQIVQHLQRVRAALMLQSQPLSANEPRNDDHDDDDIRADIGDIDEFRRRLARRIDAFVASRTEPSGARRDAEATPVGGA